MEFWKGLSRRTFAILITCFFIAFVAAGFIIQARLFEKSRLGGSTGDEIILPSDLTLVTIYVTGAVRKPGVYSLPQGSRVKDAIKKAGGAIRGWDPEGINIAKRLEDEDMVVVPRIVHEANRENLGRTASTSRPHTLGKKAKPNHAVSLNQATLSDLQALPGIGPGMAKRIVDYRTNHGGFSSIDDIQNVPGLGEKKFQKMRPFLRL